MKKILIAALALAFATPSFARGGHSGSHHSSKPSTGAGAKSSREHVSAYTKKDGTHVAAHNRSTKDETKDNNWSTKGNTNPETGKAGTK
jgi:hypothetical protein